MVVAAYGATASVVAYVVSRGTAHHAKPSVVGIGWTGITAGVMFALAAAKTSTGRALENSVLRTEGRVTLIDAVLATAVLVGLALNAAFGVWWADPLAGYVIVFYGAREAREIFTNLE